LVGIEVTYDTRSGALKETFVLMAADSVVTKSVCLESGQPQIKDTLAEPGRLCNYTMALKCA